MTVQYTHNSFYQRRIAETLDNALSVHKRIISIRVDLRIPDGYPGGQFPQSIITRFFESLKAKIAADLVRKQHRWQRSLSCQLKFAWVREFGPVKGKKHYHALLFLNKDVYHSLGDFNRSTGNLSAMIRQAWCSALALGYESFFQLVHFPEHGVLHVDANDPDFLNQRERVLRKADYLAKEACKHYGDGERSFGCSR